jgi:hypothetical protein
MSFFQKQVQNRIKDFDTTVIDTKAYVKGLSFLESLIVGLCILAFLSICTLGIFLQNQENNDEIKRKNIFSLQKALDQFYSDSSITDISKKYPLSFCSTTKPNSIDYEYTLKKSLTTPLSITNSFSYVTLSSFPQDPNSSLKSLSENPSDCLNSNKNIDQRSYSKDNLTCVKNCYLYNSSPTGDSYNLSFYSNSVGKYFILSQVRNQAVKTEYLDNI